MYMSYVVIIASIAFTLFVFPRFTHASIAPEVLTELKERGYQLGEQVDSFRLRQSRHWQRIPDDKYLVVAGRQTSASHLVVFKKHCRQRHDDIFYHRPWGNHVHRTDVIYIANRYFGIRRACVIDKIYALKTIVKTHS